MFALLGKIRLGLGKWWVCMLLVQVVIVVVMAVFILVQWCMKCG